MSATVIISRNRSASPEFRRLEDTLVHRCLADAGLPVVVMPDIYDIPEDSVAWRELEALQGPIIVAAWLHPRPTEWILRSHCVAAPVIHAFNLTTFASADECYEALVTNSALQDGVGEHPAQLRKLDVASNHRWYPVVDRSRCANCQQCLQFCLFGVYELDEQGHVTARNPDSCKDGCPACSRICPNGAIMFPRHPNDEAIAGAPGLIMHPDAASRHMFYRRTAKQCPVCGASGPVEPSAKGGARCEECGRVLHVPVDVCGSDQAMRNEIDVLIDSLDDLSRKDV